MGLGERGEGDRRASGRAGALTTRGAYERCEAITRSQARNFYYGIRLLPAAKRRAMSAVYAFAREVDDIGDGSLADEQKLRRLQELDAALGGLDGRADESRTR